jgi:hypothetical protein
VETLLSSMLDVRLTLRLVSCLVHFPTLYEVENLTYLAPRLRPGWKPKPETSTRLSSIAAHARTAVGDPYPFIAAKELSLKNQ